MSEQRFSIRGCMIQATVLLTLFILSAAAFGQEAEDVARFGKELDSDDRATAVNAFKELTAIGKKRLKNESAEARRLLDDYQRRKEEFLSRYGGLRLVTKESVPLAEMHYVHTEPNTEHVAVVAPECTDEHVRFFAKIPTLSFLVLQGTKANGAFLPEMPTGEFKILRFNESPLDESYLLKARFPKLEMLDVRSTPVTSKLIENLDAPELQWFYFGDTKIDSEGLAHLKRYKKLHCVRVDLAILTRPMLAQVVSHNPMLHFEVNCQREDFEKLLALKWSADPPFPLRIRAGDPQLSNRFDKAPRPTP